MKKLLLISSLVAATTATGVHAESGFSEARRAGVFFTSAIAGAVVAGPIGMMAATAGGIWLDEQVVKAAEMERVETTLAEATVRNEQLVQQLLVAQTMAEQYAQTSLEQLQLHMLFKTGSSELASTGKQQLAMLAAFIKGNPDFFLQLDGYTDPRGDSSYNLSLSIERVQSVTQQLLLLGVDKHRVSTYSHGDSLSSASSGDYDDYAMQRIVRIQLSRKNRTDAVATAEITQP